MELIFLGLNNFGSEIYSWLCERETVSVRALVTKPDQLDLVEQLQPDVIVAAGFSHIVPPETLAVPKHGCINVHPGLLPETRGYNPNVWSIIEGLPAGVTIHRMDETVDTGPIIARRQVEKNFADTGKILYNHLEEAAVDLFRETWPEIESGDYEETPQDDTRATFHRKVDFLKLCELDPEVEYPVKDLIDRLRALTFPPFKNAHVEVDGRKYYIEVDITPASEADEAGYGHLSSYKEDRDTGQ